MALTLRISSFQGPGMGADATRVFQEGGTIGRSPDNDWVLPDPERFVSSRHAEIRFDAGEYVLTDCSTNGTSINGRELTKGARVRLGSGDVVTIGSYEISVLVHAAAAAQVPYAAAVPYAGAASRPEAIDALLAPSSAPLAGDESSVDPLDFFADPGDVSLGREPAAAPDHSPPYSDFFAPPRVGRDPALAQTPHARAEAPAHRQAAQAPAGSPAHAAGGGGADAPAGRPKPAAEPRGPAAGAGPQLIPENWDATGFSSVGAPVADARPVGDADSFAEPETVDPSASRPRDPLAPPDDDSFAPAGAGPFAPAGDDRVASHADDPFAPLIDDPLAPPPDDRFAAPERDTPAAPAPVRPEPPAAGGVHAAADCRAETGGARAADLAAVLRAAGVDPAAVPPETLASLGEALRVVVEGLMDVLRARAEIKNQFRVAMTTLKPVENNPLKFSANADDALFNLFARRGHSFKAPVDAFKEAFDDLRAHQVATMAGMRAAFSSLISRFDPNQLQEGFDRGLKRGALLDVMNKTKYWDLYREMYEALGDDDATFRRLFGDEFAQAYEEQMQRLTALQRRK